MSDAHTGLANILLRQSGSGADFDSRDRQPFFARVPRRQTFHERHGFEACDEDVVAG